MVVCEISPEALEDLQTIQNFIALDSTDAADRMIDELLDAFEHLATWPKTGHARPDLTAKLVRFWAVGSSLVVYREQKDGIQVAAVLHGSRDVPSVLNAR